MKEVKDFRRFITYKVGCGDRVGVLENVCMNKGNDFKIHMPYQLGTILYMGVAY